jgi:hypothetical protein
MLSTGNSNLSFQTCRLNLIFLEPTKPGASEQERINQIEEKISPQIVNDIRAEHLEKRNNDQNITYQKENRTVKSSTEVDLNSLPFAEIANEDRLFIERLTEVGKELGS